MRIEKDTMGDVVVPADKYWGNTLNKGLKDRVILVTGASGGIGAATVRMLVKEEAKVIASGRNEDKLAKLAMDTGCDVLPFDLDSELSVKDALSGIEVFGIVNCGGWGGEIASPMETDLEVFDKVTSVNARGTLLVTKYASQGMIKAGLGGSIVNVSSQASLVGLAGHISYASSKGAVDAMTRVSALELGKYNIRVNAVNPTVVMTPMSEWYWGAGRHWWPTFGSYFVITSINLTFSHIIDEILK